MTDNVEATLAESGARRRVLVTGAAGNIGSYFSEHSHDKYDLTLMVLKSEHAAKIREFGSVIEGDIGDLDFLNASFEGIDTVVHLAGDPSPSATWESLLPNNIVGTHNVYEAAAAAGCRRVIFASSIHAVVGSPVGRQIRTDDPVHPANLYGVSKCFGEAMGRYMATRHELSVIALRIGAFLSDEAIHGDIGVVGNNIYLSQRR